MPAGAVLGGGSPLRSKLAFSAHAESVFNEPAANASADVRAGLEKGGKPIGPLDTLIGAHALSLGAVLVTNNAREFRRTKGLAAGDWLA